MEFKGTKEKWEINDEKSNGIIDASIAYNIQSTSNYLDICAVWKDVDSDDEAKSNAKLIAAAPEMFEMLKDVLAGMRSENYAVSTHEIQQLLTKITQ